VIEFIRNHPALFMLIVGSILLPVSLAVKDWEDRQ
jgi:hypothetical protein